MQEAKRHWRVLVVEDEAKVARALREGLERENYEVVVAPTGEEGFFLVNAEEFDLVILDLMLPGRDGLQVLATLRKRGLQTPVLILTARDAIEDRVEGLQSRTESKGSTKVRTITLLSLSLSRSSWRGSARAYDGGEPSKLFS